MHVGHKPWIVCSLDIVEALPDEYLFGLLLHEFGHMGSGGGERAADRWIEDTLQIRIYYKGPLDLEWVNQEAIDWIRRGGR